MAMGFFNLESKTERPARAAGRNRSENNGPTHRSDLHARRAAYIAYTLRGINRLKSAANVWAGGGGERPFGGEKNKNKRENIETRENSQ